MTPTCTVCELHAESTFKIEGMDCREEVAMLERRFKHLAGLEDFSADLLGQRLHVKYDAAKLSAGAISDAVADTGMRAWLEHEEPIAIGESSLKRRQWAVIGSGVLLGAGLAGEALGAAGARWLFALSFAVALPLPARRAWHALKVRSLDINVLMMIAASGAIALGQLSEAAAVVFLFAVAQMLEARTLDRARNAIRALMDLTPGRSARSRWDDRAQRRRRAHRSGRGDRDPSRRQDPARRRGGRRAELRQPGADHGRIAAGGQELRRRSLCRHDQRPRRARSAGDAPAPRHDARPDHPPRRARTGAARACSGARRAIRARLHARGDRPRADRGDRAAADRRTFRTWGPASAGPT